MANLGRLSADASWQDVAHGGGMTDGSHRVLLEAIDVCILELDRDGYVRFANRFATECLGRSLAELASEPLHALVHSQRHTELARAIEAASAGATRRNVESEHGQDGRVRRVRWTISPLAIEGDLRGSRGVSAGCVLAVGVDATDLMNGERRRAEREGMAVMGALATSLAHEIRNPLNSAKLQLELLVRRARKSVRTEQQPELESTAAVVGDELMRLSTLLDEFLSLARPRLPVRRGCAVRDLLESVVSMKQPVARAAGVRLRVRLDDPELRATVDPHKLTEALVHLVRNAIDALSGCGEGNVVLAASRRPDGAVSFLVEDDGPGLAKEMRHELAFQPFVTNKPGGTGLGLAIAQKIASQHGGGVELLDRPQGGTIARLWVDG